LVEHKGLQLVFNNGAHITFDLLISSCLGPNPLMDYLLRVEIFKPISAMGILVIKGLLMVVTYHLLPKDEANGISEMGGWW